MPDALKTEDFCTEAVRRDPRALGGVSEDMAAAVLARIRGARPEDGGEACGCRP